MVEKCFIFHFGEINRGEKGQGKVTAVNDGGGWGWGAGMGVGGGGWGRRKGEGE